MKWVIEENFENIAKFLGDLFNKTPEEINERFVNIPVMFLLKFIDENDDDKILGTIVGVKDEVAPNILELIHVAFLPDIDLQELNVFYKLINFCKMEFVEAIYAFNMSDQSFININIDKLPDEVMVHKRMSLLLTKEHYVQKWYDLGKTHLLKEKYDSLDFNRSFKLKKGRRTQEFKLKALYEVSTDKIARLMNVVYSKVDFTDNVVLLSKHFSSYNISLMMKLISGYYGRLSNKTSMLVENSKGELVGYILNMAPVDKKGVIVDLVVHPDYRGIGLGKVLFRNTIIKYYEEDKCETVSLAVTSNNDIAKILYLKNGFEIVGKEGKEAFLFID